MATLRSRLPDLQQLSPSNARQLMRWIIIGVMLMAVAYLSQAPSMRLLPIPFIIIAMWQFLRFPGLGPLAVLVASLTIGFSLGTGTQTSLHLGFLFVPLFTGLWVAKMLYQRSFSLVSSAANIPLIGLVVTATLSLVAGNLAWNAFAQTAPLRTQIGALGMFVVSAAAFWLVANEIKTLAWLKALTWTFIGIGAIYIVGRLIPGLSFYLRWIQSDAVGSLFWVWLVALAGGQALFNRSLAFGWRFLCGLLALAALVVGLLPAARGWASGWLPALVGVAVLLWLRWPRLTAVLAVIGLGAGLLAYPAVSSFLLGGDNQYSLLTRGAALDIIIGIARANLLLGIGPANYYYYTPLFPILGYYVRFNSHNQYVDLLAQTGVLGLLFFFLFFLAVWRTGWRLRRRFQDGFAHAYINACLAGLVATVASGLLGDWVIPFVYNVGIAGMRASILAWLFLGGVVALDAMRDRLSPRATVQS